MALVHWSMNKTREQTIRRIQYFFFKGNSVAGMSGKKEACDPPLKIRCPLPDALWICLAAYRLLLSASRISCAYARFDTWTASVHLWHSAGCCAWCPTLVS